MIAKALLTALVMWALLSTVPLPHSEEGRAVIAPGEEWSSSIDLEASAHVTCIVHSGDPVDVEMLKENTSGGIGETAVNTVNSSVMYRSTESLEAGAYRLVVVNHGNGEVWIEYQVHQDYIVVANMTAKNIMGLSLALSMGIVALFLFGRPRRP
jgi:hypothetical protein